jgi:hypothetical protein
MKIGVNSVDGKCARFVSQVRVIEIVVHFGFVLPKNWPLELRLFALILQSLVVVLPPDWLRAQRPCLENPNMSNRT